MDIGFVWDEVKYQAVITKHNVKFYEVVSAFDDPNGFESFDPVQNEDRWLWVGKTFNARLLIVVYTEQDFPLYRIITAYDAERSWLDEYYNKR